MSRVVAVPKTIVARGIARVYYEETFLSYVYPSEILSDGDRRPISKYNIIVDRGRESMPRVSNSRSTVRVLVNNMQRRAKPH